MGEHMHVVKRRSAENGGEITLLAVFSNEGLAQTYAAKLRLLRFPGLTYFVEPLTVDDVATHEVVYLASYQDGKSNADNTALKLDASKINVDPAFLGNALPEGTSSATKGMERSLYTFRAFGWSETEARARLLELVHEYFPDCQAHA